MQAQSLRQQTTISPQQSLTVIKTLLSASFGCIAYLRNLLPDENFGEGRLTSGERNSMSYGVSSQDLQPENQRHISGVTIKTVTRGFSTEADKLLNYLEHGIFHAIERQYLKSFIFAIYLDNDDPNNIVEAYTYTLIYHTIPGTNTTVPIMSLDDQLNNLSLNGRSNQAVDPVAVSTFKGKAPTLGDVKQSVKALIKNLIIATQSLEPLPKRRFATFKLFYRENTPPEYEPPFFRPGDPNKDKFVFTTHDKAEVPEKFSVGSVATPYHGIDVQVQSVAKYIPNNENNDSQFLGIEVVPKNGLGGLSGVTDSGYRSKQLEAQRKDAEERVFAWSAEDPRWTDADAEGEDDPEDINDSGIGMDGLLGMRKADGSIIPLDGNGIDAMETDDDVQFYGRPEIVPSRVGELRSITAGNTSDTLEPTQQLEATQVISSMNGSLHEIAAKSSTTQKDLIDNSVASRGVDTQMLKAMLAHSATDWCADDEMLDIETQPANAEPFHDSIESYSHENATDQASGALLSRTSNTRSHAENIDDAACACELDYGDDLLQCDNCQKWLHLWCMGYHSPEDSRLPSNFVCIPCRLQGDINFHLIKDAYPDILAAFMVLALFRRSIKLVEAHNPESLKEFRKVAKCEASSAEQLWKRLEREGFIVLEVTETDKLGLLETRTRATRSSAKKKVKRAKEVQKYIFNKAVKKTTAYMDYFSPGNDAEKTMLGLKDMVRLFAYRRVMIGLAPTVRNRGVTCGNPVSAQDAQDDRMESQTQTQTQEDTQTAEAPTSDLKRRTGSSSQETVHAVKKMKISVGEGVDIEE
ncbi:hypothetical protein EW145_g6266 [Phellinidium pouzarii]|uniref:HORMA domain-containing protein n=1 Tax=Phellinidium pouzarii TaxID=167371 RepID=A0A4S4KYA6_9AGAM|nr:hypothetical protein EW145_g6266 [Phellinidium pouzarii]